MNLSGVRGMVGLALAMGVAQMAQGEASTTLNVASDLHYSQDEFQPEPETTAPVLAMNAPRWTSRLEISAWLPTYVNGNSKVKDVRADISVHGGQLFDDFDSYATGLRFETWNDEGWGIWGEVQYLSFDGDNFSLIASGVPLNTRASLQIDSFIADVGAGFRLIDAPANADGEGWGTLDLFAALRYQNLDQQIYASPSQQVNESEDFFEPMIGGRVVVGFNESMSFIVRNDLSGFGIGDGSELTWTIQGGMRFTIERWFELDVAYRYFEIDYDAKSGLDSFGINMGFNGPYIGGVVKF
jgi:opacity protein-like surface antigen